MSSGSDDVKSFRLPPRDDVDLDAAVPGPARGGCVGRDGLRFAETADREAAGVDLSAHQELEDGFRPALGEFPVVGGASGRIGVAVDVDEGPLVLVEDEGDGIESWISGGERSIDDSRSVLQTIAFEPDLEHRVAVAMKPAWKSRAKANIKKRDEQLAEVEKTGPLGIG